MTGTSGQDRGAGQPRGVVNLVRKNVGPAKVVNIVRVVNLTVVVNTWGFTVCENVYKVPYLVKCFLPHAVITFRDH